MKFSKYQANGNDFILIDHRNPEWNPTRAEIARLCHRRYGIGADGLILLTGEKGYDFGMKNYNSDGGECTMCGNGGRALLRFARDLGILAEGRTARFLAIDGEHEGWVRGEEVGIRMQAVKDLRETPAGFALDTGSPHLIVPVARLLEFDVVAEGRRLRNSAAFLPNGINVNFVEERDGRIFLRTYERGVEDETHSCGTGAIATAIVTCLSSPRPGERRVVEVHCQGGILEVSTLESAPGRFEEIWLSGRVEKTFEGER